MATSRRFAAASLAILLACGSAGGADPSPLTHLAFTRSLEPGFKDANGRTEAGTEVMHLVPYRGRLYASTSLWMESGPNTPKACQILALDSPTGSWRVEHQFTTNNLRWGTLRTVTFATDGDGRAMAPVELLLAAPDVIRGKVVILSRNDDTGEWMESVLGTTAESATEYATTRAIGIHRDRITGVDRVVAGNNFFGVTSGVYDAAAPARLRWENKAEFQVAAGERVMGFCECNGVMYCATSRHIFQRQDGPVPSWKDIQFYPEEKKACGVRGLTAAPNPSGQGEVLLFAALSKVRRLHPAEGFKETVEMDLPEFLTQHLGPTRFVLAAYNEFTPFTLPGTGEKLWLFGFESIYQRSFIESNPSPSVRTILKAEKGSYFAQEGRFCIRHANGAAIRYEVAEVTDPALPELVATRAIAVSPFAEDAGRAFYFSGYDCNSMPSHNTGWIYRAELPAH